MDRGYVRPEDEPTVCDPEVGSDVDNLTAEGLEAGATVQHAAISVASPQVEEEDDEDVARPLPDRLIIELTAHRTLALRDAMAENPAITFQAVLHNFVLRTFYRFATSATCLEIALHTPNFPAQAPGLNESASAKAIDARHEGWKGRLPKSEKDLWKALTALDGTAQASLFALSTLVEAVAGTLQRRETDAPTEMPVALTAQFAGMADKQALWTGFLRRNPPTLPPPPFDELLIELRRFLEPVLTALALPESASGRWSPDRGAWE